MLFFVFMRTLKLRSVSALRLLATTLGAVSLLTACGSDGAAGTSANASAGGTSSGGQLGADSSAGQSDAEASGGPSGAGSTGVAGAASGIVAGNPNGSCSAGVPASGQPASIANPTAIVGTGTAASCSFDALKAAVTQGGVITFNCGAAPVTLAISATLSLPTNKNTVIDGGNKITLDGGKAVQILRFDSANFQANESVLTLQHIALKNGKATPTEAIPAAPA